MKGLFIFVAGAGVGAGTAWYLTKRHYQKIADEEIADVVERFRERAKEITEKNKIKVPDLSPRATNVVEFDRPVSGDSVEELSSGVIDNPTGVDNGEDEDTDESEDAPLKPYEKEGVAPYTITEEEFGDNEDYDQKTLFWYYRDNILATDEDLEVEDKFTTVGNALEEFSKDRYIERVYVRNEQDETDYEILLSEKHFYEVTGEDKE